MEKKDYFKPKQVELSLSQSDVDILLYAMYNINWKHYKARNYGGEEVAAACVHLDDIENQLSDYFELDENTD